MPVCLCYGLKFKSNKRWQRGMEGRDGEKCQKKEHFRQERQKHGATMPHLSSGRHFLANRCVCERPPRHRGLRPHLEEVPRPLLPLLQQETHMGGRREGLQGTQRPLGEHPQPGRAELHQRWAEMWKRAQSGNRQLLCHGNRPRFELHAEVGQITHRAVC